MYLDVGTTTLSKYSVPSIAASNGSVDNSIDTTRRCINHVSSIDDIGTNSVRGAKGIYGHYKVDWTQRGDRL